MALEDFERELAASNAKTSSSRKRSRSKSRERHRRHHGRSKHDHDSRYGDDKHHKARNDSHERSRHSHKRSKHDERGDSKEQPRRSHRDEERQKRKPLPVPAEASVVDDDEDDWIEPEPKEAYEAPPDDEELDDLLEEAADKNLQRDDWMKAPSSLNVDYVQRKREEPKPVHLRSTKADNALKLHNNELNHLLKDLQESGQGPEEEDPPPDHEVDYEFGDNGSQWRMTKLKSVYRKAEETGKPVEEVALDRFSSLREFDDAREEEIELDRRKMYGRGYVGKIKPSGELYEERRLKEGINRPSTQENDFERIDRPSHEQGKPMAEVPNPTVTAPLDQTALNRLKAQVMRAKLKGGPEAAKLEAEYADALAHAANNRQPDVVVLNAAENRMLAGGRKGEVKAIDNKRGRERGLVEENEDMSIEDMVRQERRTKGVTEGAAFAERIARDAKFTDDLDYLDENATKLSKHMQKSDINLRNMAIGDFQKMQRALETCPLCHHEDKDEPPLAPIVSLGTRVYLTLPTEPELTPQGAVIVPIQHRTNLLECDDDEWEELRNFMKCLTRLYHAQNRAVVFYENAAAPHRRLHAAMVAVPIPYALGETAPAFFREAVLASDEEWSQHRKIIDTLGKAKGGLGRSAFRRSIAKEMPYFHVWFEVDGGIGHIVEDERRWPKGDLFAREVIGGMVDAEPQVIKRQGRWRREDPRVEGFRKKWHKFDWTRVLLDAEN